MYEIQSCAERNSPEQVGAALATTTRQFLAACIAALVAFNKFCVATPLDPAVPATRPAIKDSLSEPICTEPGFQTAIASPAILQAFPSSCLDSAKYFFNMPSPGFCRTPWHWKRFGPGETPRAHDRRLPHRVASGHCMIALDVISDAKAEDQFALTSIEAEFQKLFKKCVKGRMQGPSAGYIPVGPRKVLKLQIGPVPLLVEANGGYANETSAVYGTEEV
ncbi:MAG: hypothetical protein Q9166_003461 [cf. Caloplaca sp. 2 TL-2023]